jgi:hypothetical protein
MSVGLAICAMADLFQIEVLIESGTYNARSTDIFARYFSSDIPIHTMDIEIRQEATERLAPYPNVKQHEGDSRKVVLELLEMHKGKRIGVFIDGPKGRAAVRMAIDVLNSSDVAFVALHDMNKTEGDGKTPAGGRALFNTVMPFQITTDEPWFYKKYQSLDSSENKADTDQHLKWEPFSYSDTTTGEISRHLGSYGPTVGFTTLAI